MSDKKRKILHLHFGKEGGAERFFVNLAKAFHARGQDQRFVIRPGRTWEQAIRPLGDVTMNNYRRLSLSGFLLDYKVRKMARDWQPDAIMAWMPRAARLIPNYDPAMKFVRLGDFPVHLDHFKNCDVLVGNIPGIGQHCLELGWPKAVETISNFPREFDPKPVTRASLNTPDDAFVVSSSGRFVHRKGFDLLIRAIDRIPNAYLWLVGDGKERENLEKLARDSGVMDRTRFLGWVDEPAHYVASSDAFVMASRHEPLGNVAIEAWALDIPVVSTRSEGPSWYMTHNENGYMTDIDDLDDIVRGLEKIRTNPTYAQTLVKGAQAKIAQTFTKDQIVSQYFDLIDGKTRTS